MTPRAQILADAAALIDGQREQDYGPPAENFARLAALWSAYAGIPLSAPQVCDMLALLKLSRLAHDPGHRDSRVDGCGYLALGGEVGE